MLREDAPLLSTSEVPKKRKFDVIGEYSIHIGAFLFALFIFSVMVQLDYVVFSNHPLFMTIFVILSTEGIIMLQSAETLAKKRNGLKLHTVVQIIGYMGAVLGFIAVYYNKDLRGKDHFTSVHGKVGVFTFAYLLLQSIVGLIIGYAPNLVIGQLSTAKRYWKLHRIGGYILLIFVWLSTQSGIQTNYVAYNLWSPHMIWLYGLSLVMMIGGVVCRIRPFKLGLRQGARNV